MAAPTVRGIGAFGSGTTSFVAAVPTGGSAPQAGDALYIIMESSDSTTAAGTPNTPAGWTKLHETTVGAGATNVTTLTIFGKIAGAGEANVTVDGVGDHCAGAMVVIANHGLGAITGTVVGAAQDHGTSTANLLAPSITVTADSLIIVAMGLTDDANDTTNVSGVTNANLASITERIDQTVATGAGGGVGIYTATCAGTTTGTTEWDHDTAANSQSVQLGVRPKQEVAGNVIASTLALFAAAAKYVVVGATLASGLAAFAPTVEQSGGAQAVTSAHRASTVALSAPTAAYRVAPATLASGASLSAPSARQNVTGAHRSSTTTTSQPSAAYRVAAPTIGAGTVVNAPRAAYRVVGATLAAGSTLSAPSVAPGAVAVVGSHRGSTVTLSAATLAYRVAGTTRASSVATFSPAVSAGAAPIAGAHRASTAVLHLAVVAPGAVGVAGSHRSSTATITGPALAARAAAPSIASGSTLTAPSVTTGIAAITGAHIPTTLAMYGPGVRTGVPVDEFGSGVWTKGSASPYTSHSGATPPWARSWRRK